MEAVTVDRAVCAEEAWELVAILAEPSGAAALGGSAVGMSLLEDRRVADVLSAAAVHAAAAWEAGLEPAVRTPADRLVHALVEQAVSGLPSDLPLGELSLPTGGAPVWVLPL